MDQLFIVVNINSHVLLLFGCTVILFTSYNFNIIFQRIILNKFKNMADVMTHSDNEMADMHFIYGRSNGSALQASRLYAETYPD